MDAPVVEISCPNQKRRKFRERKAGAMAASTVGNLLSFTGDRAYRALRYA